MPWRMPMVLALLVLSSPVPPRAVTIRPSEWVAVEVHVPTGRARDTVVLLPALLGSGPSVQRVVEGLVAEHALVAVIDPLGMGASARPRDADYSLEAQAQRIVAVLDTLGWSRVWVAGVATSGTIALRVAARAPDRVHGVLSIAGGPVASQRTAGVRTVARLATVLDSPLGRPLARRHFAGQLKSRSGRSDWLTPSALQRYLDPVLADLSGQLVALQRMSEASEPEPIEAVLARVTAPVHLLVGAIETPGAPTAAQVRLLQQHVRHTRVDSVPAAGAMLVEEAPDAVLAALRRLRARG
jgi:pimeloyl-ACP methyl ester carboxylesterase